ncbi:MAG: peptidoglycan-binding domain-containing protein [Alphaproteobacteria bacterium]
MQRQSSNRGRGSGRKNQAEIGAVARVVDRAFDDPAASGGLFVLTLTIMAIMSNAMFLQPVSHPKPLFQTRAEPAIVTDSTLPLAAGGTDVSAVPLPRTRGDAPPLVPLDVVIPAPTVAPAADAMPAPVVEIMPAPVDPLVAAPDPQRVLVLDIQRELARIGLYSGAIDGIAGARTRAAVASYQAAAGLPATGELDRDLLLLLTAPAAKVPPLPIGAESGFAPAGTDSITTAGTPRAAITDLLELERRGRTLEIHARFTRVQAALNKIGYGPLAIDGEGDAETLSAIRRFELDHGLDISGRPSDALIARLIAIGAMAPG